MTTTMIKVLLALLAFSTLLGFLGSYPIDIAQRKETPWTGTRKFVFISFTILIYASFLSQIQW